MQIEKYVNLLNEAINLPGKFVVRRSIEHCKTYKVLVKLIAELYYIDGDSSILIFDIKENYHKSDDMWDDFSSKFCIKLLSILYTDEIKNKILWKN